MRILVTGSRNWRDAEDILAALNDAAAHMSVRSSVIVVHGACPTGADYIADRIAPQLGFQVERHPADWTGPCREGCLPEHRRRDPQRGSGSYCPRAGFYRNQEMVDLGADVVLAFQRNRSRGTQDCVNRARAAGLTVILKEE